jgi:hypothetical protein
MLADIGLVPFEYYLYGQEESAEEHEPPVPHADENETVEEDQDVVDDGDKKLAAVVFNTTGDVTHSITGITGNATQSLTSTTRNVTQSLAAKPVNVAQSTTAPTGNAT